MPQADYIALAEKLERAVQNLLLLSGVGNQIYTSGYSGERVLPNITVYAPTISNIKPWRLEGVCHLQILHNFQALVQPNEDINQRKIEREKAVGLTISVLSKGDNQSLQALADDITNAGRDLAILNTNLTGDAANADALMAGQNADMLNFRCDEILFGDPFLERGPSKADAAIWAIDLNYTCRCSCSNGASD